MKTKDSRQLFSKILICQMLRMMRRKTKFWTMNRRVKEINQVVKLQVLVKIQVKVMKRLS